VIRPSPTTIALRTAAVAVMPADLAVHVMAAVDAVALVEACDVVAESARAMQPWFDAVYDLCAAACYDVRRSGVLPTWWDAGHDDAADRHARSLNGQVAA